MPHHEQRGCYCAAYGQAAHAGAAPSRTSPCSRWHRPLCWVSGAGVRTSLLSRCLATSLTRGVVGLLTYPVLAMGKRSPSSPAVCEPPGLFFRHIPPVARYEDGRPWRERSRSILASTTSWPCAPCRIPYSRGITMLVAASARPALRNSELLRLCKISGTEVDETQRLGDCLLQCDTACPSAIQNSHPKTNRKLLLSRKNFLVTVSL